MTKNAYANKLFQTKETAYADGLWAGFSMGLDIVAIALNQVYGFADVRLTRLEAKVQELVNEIVDTADPVVTKAHIETAVQQIRRRGKENG